MTEFKRIGIEPGDPITYNVKMIQRGDNWNQLNLVQLYRHIGRKVDSCVMYNVFEVILHLLYHDNVLRKFPQFRNLCDGSTPIVNLNVTLAGKGTKTVIIRYNLYSR